jgi:hypothetical protein
MKFVCTGWNEKERLKYEYHANLQGMPAGDTARQMLKAAREKHVSEELHQVLEPPPISDKTSARRMPDKL